MEKESLHFKIGISGTGSSYPCNFSILINDTAYVQSESTPTTTYYEFDSSISEGANSLKIELLDKAAKHIVKDLNGNLKEDFLLNIDSVEVDGISLDSLLWTHSKYYPKYPENYEDFEQKSIEIVTNCVTLGWNGTWTLEFDSPFYIWLLENI